MAAKTLAPVGFARTHILALREREISVQRIAKAAGVKTGFVNGIVYGDGKYARQHADADSIKKVLALTEADIPPAPGSQARKPYPTAQRRVQALHAAGFPWGVIARHVGVQRECITKLSRDGHAQPYIGEAVHRVYDTLRHTTPADEGISTYVENQSRKNGATNGWHTPAWWDLHGGIDTGTAPTARPGSPRPALPEQPAKGWEKHSACRNEDPDLFYPDSYTTPAGRMQVASAKAICGRCPVRALCLAAALRREHDGSFPDGIYGGTTPQERSNTTEEAAA